MKAGDGDAEAKQPMPFPYVSDSGPTDPALCHH